MTHTVEIDLQGTKITLETGKLAKQANGSVIVRSGDSVVLVSACANELNPRRASFFPLTVDYREYTYAAGKTRAALSNGRADLRRRKSLPAG